MSAAVLKLGERVMLIDAKDRHYLITLREGAEFHTHAGIVQHNDIIGVLDWNIWPRSLGRGSAIFLHLARPDHGPTAGCIALDMPDMRRLLLHLRPGALFDVG